MAKVLWGVLGSQVPAYSHSGQGSAENEDIKVLGFRRRSAHLCSRSGFGTDTAKPSMHRPATIPQKAQRACRRRSSASGWFGDGERRRDRATGLQAQRIRLVWIKGRS